MELRHLRYFVAIVQQGGITRAAVALGLTQPALSRQLRDLEEDLGTALLVRSAQGCRLTPAGERLLVTARQILELVSRAVLEAGERAGQVRLGHYGPLWLDFFSSALRRFQKRHPKLRLEPLEFSPRELRDGLLKGALDFVLLGSPLTEALPGCERRRVAEVKASLAFAAAHPLAKRRVLALAELRTETWLGWDELGFPGRNQPLLEACEAAGFRPKFAGYMDSAGSMLLRLASGPELAVVLPMSRKLPHAGIAFSRLRGDPVRYTLDVAWPTRHPQAPAFTELAGLLAAVGLASSEACGRGSS